MSMFFALWLQRNSVAMIIVTETQWNKCNVKLMSAKQLKLLDVKERNSKNMIIDIPFLNNKIK